MNRSFYQGLLIPLLCLLTAGGCFAQEYDIVINNGRVMDPETMYDDIANVGIKDGRIAVITKDRISGKETIDAFLLGTPASQEYVLGGITFTPNSLLGGGILLIVLLAMAVVTFVRERRGN